MLKKSLLKPFQGILKYRYFLWMHVLCIYSFDKLYSSTIYFTTSYTSVLKNKLRTMPIRTSICCYFQCSFTANFPYLRKFGRALFNRNKNDSHIWLVYWRVCNAILCSTAWQMVKHTIHIKFIYNHHLSGGEFLVFRNRFWALIISLQIFYFTTVATAFTVKIESICLHQ